MTRCIVGMQSTFVLPQKLAMQLLHDAVPEGPKEHMERVLLLLLACFPASLVNACG